MPVYKTRFGPGDYVYYVELTFRSVMGPCRVHTVTVQAGDCGAGVVYDFGLGSRPDGHVFATRQDAEAALQNSAWLDHANRSVTVPVPGRDS